MQHFTALLLCALIHIAGAHLRLHRPNYSVYHSYDRYKQDVLNLGLEAKFRSWIRVDAKAQYPVRVGDGREDPLYVVRVTNFNTQRQKLKVLVSFGEHAREFIVVETFFGLIANLTKSAALPCTDRTRHLSRFVLDHFELHLIGMLNPSGRVHLENTGDFCWRNTMPPSVDINRNFDWEFGGPGSSFKVGHEEYNGGTPFSIPESRLVRDLALQHNYTAVFSIHSGTQQIFMPFVDSKSRRIHRRRSTTDRELQIVRSVERHMNGYFHDSGIAYLKNEYSADGTMFDYLAGVLQVPYSFCTEVWGGSWSVHPDCFVQFNPMSKHVPKVQETFNEYFLFSLMEIWKDSLGSSPPPAHMLPQSTVAGQLQQSMCRLESGLERLAVALDNQLLPP